jgi:hypothetical protein
MRRDADVCRSDKKTDGGGAPSVLKAGAMRARGGGAGLAMNGIAESNPAPPCVGDEHIAGNAGGSFADIAAIGSWLR